MAGQTFKVSFNLDASDIASRLEGSPALEESLADDPRQVGFFRNDPSTVEMRAHPRFADVLRRLDLS